MDYKDLANVCRSYQEQASQVIKSVAPTGAKNWWQCSITALDDDVQISFNSQFTTGAGQEPAQLRQGEMFVSEKLSVTDVPAIYFRRNKESNLPAVRIIWQGN
jgi:hypothetical protein